MATMKDTIQDYIQAQILGGQKVAYSSRLITSGFVNSLEMVSVKTFLEAHYHVRIPDAMATRETFDSVDSIAQVLEGLGIR